MDIKEVRTERIKSRMNELGINSRDLAKRSGISESGISRILSGEIDPRLKTFMKISEALRCDYVWLMGYDELQKNEGKSLTIDLDRLTPTNQAALIATYHALLNSQEGNE